MKTIEYEITFTMNNKKSQFNSKDVKHAFTGNKLTNYAGLSPIMHYGWK